MAEFAQVCVCDFVKFCIEQSPQFLSDEKDKRILTPSRGSLCVTTEITDSAVSLLVGWGNCTHTPTADWFLRLSRLQVLLCVNVLSIEFTHCSHF